MYLLLQFVLFLKGRKFTHSSAFFLEGSGWSPFCLKSARAGVANDFHPWHLHCWPGKALKCMLSLKHLRGVGSTLNEIKAGVYRYQCFSGLQPLLTKEDTISFSVVDMTSPCHFDSFITKSTAYFSLFF